MAKSGKDLYLCIKASTGDLKMHAQNQQYALTLDIGYSDIQSLEPCDSLLNPLGKVRPPQDLKPEIDRLEGNLKSHLKRIDQISRAGEIMNEDESDDFADEIDVDDVYVNDEIKPGVWQNYIKFLTVMDNTLERGIEHFRLDGYRAGVFIGLAYRAATKYVNSQEKNKSLKLRNLWNRLGQSNPVRASTTYVRKVNNFKVDEFDKFWYRHVVNENNNRSIFSNNDKFKIMNNAIEGVLLLQNLISYGYITSYFPLHDEYELTGWVRTKDPQPDQIEDNLRKCMDDEVFQTIYREPKFVIPEWKLGLTKIFNPPTTIIRNYYGEKIAYYFDFLGFYSKSLVFTAPIGIVLFCIYFALNSDNDVLGALLIIYGIINITSSTVFIEVIKRKEKERAAEWGQTELVESEIIRPLFKGIFRRSPVDDDLNDPWALSIFRF